MAATKKKTASPSSMPIELKLASSYRALGETQQRAFLRQASTAKCAELGSRTKAEGVYREAQKWAPIIHSAIEKHPVALRRYGKARFTWYLLCLRELGEHVASQKTRQSKATTARSALDRATESGKAVREVLAEALEILSQGDPAAEAAYSTAYGTSESPESLRRSLAALADLADAWLARTDDESLALVESVDLNADDVQLAREAHAALGDASSSRTTEGSTRASDDLATNRAEGRMLFEMRLAMSVFESAHRRTGLVPKLTPGPATKSALGPRRAERPSPAVDPTVVPS
jgi:hypothetical protein